MIIVEINSNFKGAEDAFVFGEKVVMYTPPINEKYWLFRVKLFKDQAIIGFPKFGTIGIGFAIEEDWNSNLPYYNDPEKIYNHISENKKYNEISKDDCIHAIELIRAQCKVFEGVCKN